MLGKPADSTAVPPRRTWLVFFLLLVLNYFFVSLLFPPKGPEPVSYTVFRAELEKDNLAAIHTRGDAIEGKFKSPIQWTPPMVEGKPAPEARSIENFTTILPSFVDPGLETELLKRGVDIRATPIQAKRLLGEHRARLDALVAALMQRESLDEKEILHVTGLPPAPPLSDRPKMSDLTVESPA